MSGAARFLSTLRGGRLALAIVLAFVVTIALGRAVSAAYVEILWQTESGYGSVFWQRVLWEWGIRAVAAAAVALLIVVNLRVAAKTLGGIQIRRRFGNIEISERIPKHLVFWGILSVAALLGLWFGAAVPANLGIQALLLAQGVTWGVTEPVLGHDIAFYAFWLPLLASGVTLALIVMFLVFSLVTAAYAATGTIRWFKGHVEAHDLPRLHLGSIIAVFLLLLAVRLWLQRYFLLLEGSSEVQGIFGFTDAEARLPALQTLTVICVGAAAGTLWGTLKNRATPMVASFVAVVVGSIAIGQVYPALIQRIRVEPNELARETPYIEHNLDFTRLGFGIDQLERRRFAYDGSESVDWVAAVEQFSGLPVWNASSLLATYRQLEALFPYYDFSDISIDRYPTPFGPVTVAISARQIEPSGIQDPNWQNLHIRKRYVAGMGATASLAAVKTPEGRPQMLVSGIPPEVPPGAREVPALQIDRPELFFGTRQQPYAVLSPGAEPYLAPDGSQGVAGVDYPRGIRLSSSLRTALIAWQFGDANLLFASELTDSSRFIFRRRVVDRAAAIAPFLRFPEDPYPVVADGRVYWMLEGFTGTGAFPLSRAIDFGTIRSGVRYVRNSVKVTVDAVTGAVAFYRVPVEDPLADAYGSAFPGLLRPLEEMPEGLRAHLRYPRALLAAQSRVLLHYHQETAAQFHGQQDIWNEAQELSEGATPGPYRPEYALYTLAGETEPRFQLTTVFVPVGRQNLTGTLVGRTDASGAPELILLDVPVADQVPGPRQVEALVEQDPEISEQVSLWRASGSEVWSGHLHLVPVGKRFVYFEPVFLAAEADAIPELRRFVVSDGRRVVMTEDIGSAIRELAGLELDALGLEDTLPEILTGTQGEAAPLPAPGAGSRWPAEALDLLEEAETSAREGDWQGFGEALAELRALLERLEAGGM
ncbi:MAG TPA: UPF0182 family protein [Longimicrobiales bacterium]|nr:UPF0182 family protein [Longimicrobiales bacterium]